MVVLRHLRLVDLRHLRHLRAVHLHRLRVGCPFLAARPLHMAAAAAKTESPPLLLQLLPKMRLLRLLQLWVS